MNTETVQILKRKILNNHVITEAGLIRAISKIPASDFTNFTKEELDKLYNLIPSQYHYIGLYPFEQKVYNILPEKKPA